MKRRAAAANALWSATLFWARFGINAIVFLLIASWLPVSEIGAYGAAFAIIQIIQAAQTSGLPEALIQRKGDPDVANTAFWLSTIIGIASSVLLLVAAPIVGQAMDSERVADFTRYLAIVPALTGIGAISEGMMRARLELRRLATRTAFALTAAGAVAVVMAWKGWGGWSLVALTLTNNALSTVLNVVLAKWRPRFSFNSHECRRLSVSAFHISARNVMRSSINPLAQMLVTALLGTAAGGLYTIALRIAAVVFSLSMLPVQYAALPLFSRIEDEEKRRAGFLEAAGLASLISSPLYIGAIVVAQLALEVLLGTNGAAAAPVAQGLLAHSPVLVVFNLAVPLLVAIGRASDAFRVTVLQALANVPVTILAAQVSVVWVGWSYGALHYIILPMMLVALRRYANVAPGDVLSQVFRPWLASLIMAGAIWGVIALCPAGTTAVVKLSIAMVVGVVSFPPLAFLIAAPQCKSLVAVFRSFQSRAVAR